MKPLRLQILHALTYIAANGSKHEHWGICANVVAMLRDRSATDELTDELADLSERWPESMGHPDFPVEGDAVVHLRDRRKWDMSTEFGAKRYRLLAYLIHELSKEYHANQGTS